MKPVSNPTTSQNLARNPAPSAENNPGASFASLFSSLSNANSQVSTPAPGRAPQKASQGNQASTTQSPAAKSMDEALPPSQPQQAGDQAQAATAAPAKEAQAEDEKDTASEQSASGTPATQDPLAQLLALTQQAQGQVQNVQTADTDKGRAIPDAPADKRGPAQRGLGKTDSLAAARADIEAETGTDQAAAPTDFIGHIADAQALRQTKAAAADDTLSTTLSTQDKAAPQVATPVAANVASLQRTAEMASSARAAGEHLAPRVGAAGWDKALGQKVVWMVGQGEQSASLTLNPPDLGPLQVVLTVSQSQASADFSAAQPEVRQALQDALPRLRDMLADAGISLGQANVHSGMGENAQQAQSGSQGFGNQRGNAGMGQEQSAANDNGRASTAPLRQGLGLVNTYV